MNDNNDIVIIIVIIFIVIITIIIIIIINIFIFLIDIVQLNKMGVMVLQRTPRQGTLRPPFSNNLGISLYVLPEFSIYVLSYAILFNA